MTREKAWDLTIKAMWKAVSAEMEFAHKQITEAACRGECECRIKVTPEAEYAVRTILHEEGFGLLWASAIENNGIIAINWRRDA